MTGHTWKEVKKRLGGTDPGQPLVRDKNFLRVTVLNLVAEILCSSEGCIKAITSKQIPTQVRMDNRRTALPTRKWDIKTLIKQGLFMLI